MDIELGNTFLELINRDDVVVEIGANIGGSTIQLAKLAREVFAFEPNPEGFKILKAYTNNLSNVTCFNYGISDSTRESELHIPDGGIDTSRSGTVKKIGSGTTAKIKLAPLDGFNLKPSVLVIDCEGSELDAIIGAKETLRNVRFLIVETHWLRKGVGTFDELNRYLGSQGFKLNKVLAKDHKDEDRSDITTWESVVVFERNFVKVIVPSRTKA